MIRDTVKRSLPDTKSMTLDCGQKDCPHRNRVPHAHSKKAATPHAQRHPRLDELSKDGLWRHLNGPDHPGQMPGVEGHYTKAVLVEVHRDLHEGKKR